MVGVGRGEAGEAGGGGRGGIGGGGTYGSGEKHLDLVRTQERYSTFGATLGEASTNIGPCCTRMVSKPLAFVDCYSHVQRVNP